MRILEIPIRLNAFNGSAVEMNEYAPWPERCGLWEAERTIKHDGVLYEYAGCEDGVYVYRQAHRARV